MNNENSQSNLPPCDMAKSEILRQLNASIGQAFANHRLMRIPKSRWQKVKEFFGAKFQREFKFEDDKEPSNTIKMRRHLPYKSEL